tara:strand:- start:39 stop:248 length:210 start_codon:yes stop_codon:yes gene_type:complete
MNYQIVRFYQPADWRGFIRQRVIDSGLTLEQAQAHCQNAETSSSTCSAKKRNSVRHNGAWFDGYREAQS